MKVHFSEHMTTPLLCFFQRYAHGGNIINRKQHKSLNEARDNSIRNHDLNNEVTYAFDT